MIRLLLVLVVIGLSLTLVIRSLKQTPVAGDERTTVELRSSIDEARQVKDLLEQQQDLLQQRAEAHREQ